MGKAQHSPVLDLPPLREVIARFGLSARKQLGQNFLLDINLTRRIARSAGDLSRGSTIEIGPGPGGLTRALLIEGAAHVLCIEKDARCLLALEELADASQGRLTVLQADAMDVDLREHGDAPRRIVANLPYNVATALLVSWLSQIAEDPQAFESLTLMFQKEVADRLHAEPGTKSYGRLSVLTQWLCDCQALFSIPASAFVPPPKVTSSVVRIVPRPAPLAPAEIHDLQRVTAAAFGQRRKTLRQALKPLGAPVPQLLDRAAIDGGRRGETLSVPEFCGLARVLAELRDSA